MSTPTPSTVNYNSYCCDKIHPYKAIKTECEKEFEVFSIFFKADNKTNLNLEEHKCEALTQEFVIQWSRQENYGQVYTVLFFLWNPETFSFTEIERTEVVKNQFKKKTVFKNFVCKIHNQFYELNYYCKDNKIKHHARVNAERPFEKIDL